MYAEMYQDFIGKTGPIAQFVPSAESIRRFAASFGDPDPIYADEAYAKGTVYGGIIAPPTYGFTVQFPDVPGFKRPPMGLIHAQQEFEYLKPIYAGRTYNCQSKVKDVFEKSGKHGVMIFFIEENTIYDEAMEPCVRLYKTIIARDVLFKDYDPRDPNAPTFVLGSASAASPDNIPTPLVNFAALKEGDDLPVVELPAFDRVEIARYAGAAGDFNRIHLDDESAKTVGFNGVIAHGMLTVAMETTVIKKWFGVEQNCRMKKLSVKFANPAYVGDIPTVKGKVTAVDAATGTVTLALSVEGTKGPIITGTAELTAV